MYPYLQLADGILYPALALGFKNLFTFAFQTPLLFLTLSSLTFFRCLSSFFFILFFAKVINLHEVSKATPIGPVQYLGTCGREKETRVGKPELLDALTLLLTAVLACLLMIDSSLLIPKIHNWCNY
jgi:hypothetical protein